MHPKALVQVLFSLLTRPKPLVRVAVLHLLAWIVHQSRQHAYAQTLKLIILRVERPRTVELDVALLEELLSSTCRFDIADVAVMLEIAFDAPAAQVPQSIDRDWRLCAIRNGAAFEAVLRLLWRLLHLLIPLGWLVWLLHLCIAPVNPKTLKM